MLINAKAIEYITSDRFNVDFEELLTKRQNLLQPHITIKPIDSEVKEKLLSCFSKTPTLHLI